jgi:hypothetical protein
MDHRAPGFGFYTQHINDSGDNTWPDAGVLLHQGQLSDTTAVLDYMGRIGPIAVSDGTGGVYVTWSTRVGGFLRVLTQRIQSDGTFAWGPNGTATFPNQVDVVDVDACSDGQGGMLVAADGADTLVLHRVFSVQRFDRSGSRLWGVGTSIQPGSNWYYFHPRVAADGAGGAYLVWFQDTTKVMVQHVGPTGAFLWTKPVVLSTSFRSPEWQFLCVRDLSGGVIVAWPADSPREIRAQRLAPNGSVLWKPSGVLVASGLATINPNRMSMVPDGAGGAYLTWFSRADGYPSYGPGCIRWVNGDGQLQPVNVGDGLLPAATHLFSYPNPTQHDVTLSFSLPIDAPVQLAVYDLTGRRVCIAWSGTLARGSHTLRWDGADDAGKRSPQGLYFLRLRRGAETQTTRVMLLGR